MISWFWFPGILSLHIHGPFVVLGPIPCVSPGPFIAYVHVSLCLFFKFLTFITCESMPIQYKKWWNPRILLLHSIYYIIFWKVIPQPSSQSTLLEWNIYLCTAAAQTASGLIGIKYLRFGLYNAEDPGRKNLLHRIPVSWIDLLIQTVKNEIIHLNSLNLIVFQRLP